MAVPRKMFPIIFLSFFVLGFVANENPQIIERNEASLPLVYERAGDAKNTGSQKGHRPVVLVPGLGGSQLWAKLTGKKSKPSVFCARSTKVYYNIWLSLTLLAPKAVDCTVDNFRLHYNAANHTTHNTQGVDIQPLHFGHPKSVEWLDPYFDNINFKSSSVTSGSKYYKQHHSKAAASGKDLTSASDVFMRKLERSYGTKFLGDASQETVWLEKTQKNRFSKQGAILGSDWSLPGLRFSALSKLKYYVDIVNALVSKGYTRGEDVVAAPYDFRKAPNEMAEFFNKTKRLIEDTYTKNGNSRVLVVAHSMGNPTMLYFYNHVVSQQWKDRYIHAHVALAAPWGGAVKSVKLMISGDSLGLFVRGTTMRSIERSMSSVAWLMPSTSLWGPEEVLVSTPQANYTVHQYQQLFRDLGYDDGYRMWLDTRDLTSDMNFPGVELHCLYGVNVKTPGRLAYTSKGFPNHAPQVEADDGDGTVNRRSLEAFKPWEEQQNNHYNARPPVTSLALPHVTHSGILQDPRVIQYIVDLSRA